MSNNMYLQTIKQISNLICEAELDNLQTIRALLSNVMITNTSSVQIIKDIMFEICESPLVQNENKYKIIEIAAQYEHIVTRRIRHIVFLMGFVVTAMKIISDNMNTSSTSKRKNEDDIEPIESGKRKCTHDQEQEYVDEYMFPGILYFNDYLSTRKNSKNYAAEISQPEKSYYKCTRYNGFKKCTIVSCFPPTQSSLNEQLEAKQKQIENLQLALTKSNTVNEKLSSSLKRYQAASTARINSKFYLSEPNSIDTLNGILKKEFIEYCENGDIDNIMVSNLDYLIRETELKSCRGSTFCKGIYMATKNGHTDITKFLTDYITNETTLKNITEYVKYYDFQQACIDRKLETVRQMLNSCATQQEKDQMISSADYCAFYTTSRYAPIILVRLLIENLSKDLLDDMVSRHNHIFKTICRKDRACNLIKLLCENMSAHSLTKAIACFSRTEIHKCGTRVADLLISHMTAEQREMVTC